MSVQNACYVQYYTVALQAEHNLRCRGTNILCDRHKSGAVKTLLPNHYLGRFANNTTLKQVAS